MIEILNSFAQGEEAWLEERKKYLTGTDAYKLVMGVEIDEIISAKQNNSFTGNVYTRRGQRLEPDARELYSVKTNQKVDTPAFIKNSKYPLCGYSPDGLVNEDGLIEIKCFNADRHLQNHKSIEIAIMCQIQYGLFVTERGWCDFVLYNPNIDDIDKMFFITRIYPDEKYFKKFKQKLGLTK